MALHVYALRPQVVCPEALLGGAAGRDADTESMAPSTINELDTAAAMALASAQALVLVLVVC